MSSREDGVQEISWSLWDFLRKKIKITHSFTYFFEQKMVLVSFFNTQGFSITVSKQLMTELCFVPGGNFLKYLWEAEVEILFLESYKG